MIFPIGIPTDHLDTETGAIVWNEKITTLGYDLTKDKCKQCKMYPSLLKKCMNNKSMKT